MCVCVCVCVCMYVTAFPFSLSLRYCCLHVSIDDDDDDDGSSNILLFGPLQESMRRMEQRCSDVTSPNPVLSAPTTRPRRRRLKYSSVTVASPIEARPSEAVYGQVPADYTPEQGSPGERWEGHSHDEGWGAVSLSSPSTGDELVGNAKRHRRSRQFERSQSSLETPTGKLVHSALPQRRKDLPETTTDAASGLPHSHARHYGHHARLVKPQNEPDSHSAEGSGHPSLKPKGRFRRGSHTQLGPRVARGPRSQDGGKVALRHESHFKHQAAALIRETEQGTIPRPEKRDPYNDHLNIHSNSPMKEFVGGGVGTNFPNPLGFGSFNNTYNKVPQSVRSKTNTSTQGWGNHVSRTPNILLLSKTLLLSFPFLNSSQTQSNHNVFHKCK